MKSKMGKKAVEKTIKQWTVEDQVRLILESNSSSHTDNGIFLYNADVEEVIKDFAGWLHKMGLPKDEEEIV